MAYLINLACGDSSDTLARATGGALRKDRRTQGWLESVVLSMAHVAALEPMNANILMVDEMRIGKVKTGSGAPSAKARRVGFWFVTLVSVDRDLRLVKCTGEPVESRTGETLRALIEKHAAGKRTTVVCDSFKSYDNIEELFKTERVNHKIEWVNESGYHTNTVEGAHAHFRATMRRWNTKFGDDHNRVAARLQLAAYLHGASGTIGRLVRLLELVRDNIDQVDPDNLRFPDFTPAEEAKPGRPPLSEQEKQERAAKRAANPASQKAAILQQARSDAREQRRDAANCTMELQNALDSLGERQYLDDYAVDHALSEICSSAGRNGRFVLMGAGATQVSFR